MMICIVCDSKKIIQIFEKKGKKFFKCTKCGYTFQFPIPTEFELEKYYEKSYQNGLYKIFTDESKMKLDNAIYRFNKISKFIKGKNILDVGCADGHFIAIASKKGYECTGIDISNTAVEQAQNKGLRVFNMTIENFEYNKKFDNIVCFDILEHVREPQKFVDEIKNRLTTEGKIFISTPNKRSVFQKLMGKYWFFYIPEEHLNYFDNVTIKKFLTANGFVILKHSRFFKTLTLSYGLTQFKEYNPLLFKVLKIFLIILPEKVSNYPIPFYIGEMLTVAVLKKK